MKKMILFCLMLCLICIPTAFAGQKTITLAWDYANPPADLAGFKIYQSLTSGGYDLTKPVAVIPAGSLRGALPPVADGTYYWVVTAYDTSGNQSLPSPELKHTVDATPPDSPTNLKVSVEVIINIGGAQ